MVLGPIIVNIREFEPIKQRILQNVHTKNTQDGHVQKPLRGFIDFWVPLMILISIFK